MTMVIAVKTIDSIIMTTDKRVIQTDPLSGSLIESSDDYKKIKIFNDIYIMSFAGRAFIAEQAINFIEQNIKIVEDAPSFFSEAFNYGKSCFELNYPELAPTSTFYLGYLDAGIPKLLGFSSDDNYVPLPLGATIKATATSPSAEAVIQEESIAYINEKISNSECNSLKEQAELYFQAIKRIENLSIGKTGYSVILSPFGIEEVEHY